MSTKVAELTKNYGIFKNKTSTKFCTRIENVEYVKRQKFATQFKLA